MRKMLLVLGILALALPVSAQVVNVPNSIENGLTMGLFENEIDLSFQANPYFGDFAKDFFFAGLGNPLAGVVDPTLPTYFSNYTAFDTGYLPPLMFGFYSPKLLPLPFSVFGNADFTALTARGIPSNSTVNGYTTKLNIVTGTTTTDIAWVSSTTTDAYTDVAIARTATAQFQALTKLGPAVLGLQFSFNSDNIDSDVAGAEDFFRGVTVDTYEDSTPAVGVAPTPALDFTTVETVRNFDPAGIGGVTVGDSGEYSLGTTIAFGVPFAMKTGNLEHKASLGVTLDFTDQSASYSNTESAHVYTAGGAAVDEIVLGITDNLVSTGINVNYELRMPAGGSSGNMWVAGAGAGIALNGGQYTYDYVSRPYDLTVLNTKTATAGGAHTNRISTYASGFDFNVGLSGARVVEIALGAIANFRFAPTVGLLVSNETNNGNAWESGYVQYTQVLDANGAYNGAAYNRTTRTTTGTPASTLTLAGGAGLPMGLKIKPAGWLFSIMLGAQPAITVQDAITTTSSMHTTQTIDNITGTTVNTTDISPVAYADPTSSSDFTYSLSENHYLGISVDFGGGIRVDARLNGSLLNFENFTLQGVIPLN